MKIFRSIVGKIWLTFVGLILAILLILGILLSQLFDRFYLQTVVDSLAKHATVVGDTLRTSGLEEAYAYANILSMENNATFAIADANGVVNGCTGGMGGMRHRRMGWRMTAKEMDEVKAGNIVVQKGHNPNFDLDVISVAVPVFNTSSQVEWAVIVYAPLQPISDTINRVQTYVLVVAAGALFLATILAYLLSRKISRPILRLNDVANQMVNGDFSQRVNNTGQDEIGLLSSTVNHLSERLDMTLQALKQEKGQLSNVLTSMSDAVITFDTKGNVVLANPKAEVLLNGEVGCQIDPIEVTLKAVLATGSMQQTQLEVGSRHLAVRMAPLQADDGQLTGVVALLQDITKEWQLDKMRTDFVANVSHELRTPLTLIKGYVEALEVGMGDTAESRAHLVDVISDETSRMQRLVEDLLNLARLEGQLAGINRQPLRVTALVRKVIGKFETYALEQNIHIGLTDATKEIDYIGDQDKLEQVLINLIDNGLKHTPKGGSVQVEVTDEPEGVRLSIIDSGVGIPEEDLPYIFDRFYKVEKSRNRIFKGTGLGLSIVKEIVRAHNGEISVTSNVGQGTTFNLYFPKDNQR